LLHRGHDVRQWRRLLNNRRSGELALALIVGQSGAAMPRRIASKLSADDAITVEPHMEKLRELQVQTS
jgi:hypothetical protein